MNKSNKRHKWSEYFKHTETWWQKCDHCGLYRIHLMSIAHYSKFGLIEDLTTKRPKCKPTP